MGTGFRFVYGRIAKKSIDASIRSTYNGSPGNFIDAAAPHLQVIHMSTRRKPKTFHPPLHWSNVSEWVTAQHPLRWIKAYVDTSLAEMRPLLEACTAPSADRRSRRSDC